MGLQADKVPVSTERERDAQLLSPLKTQMQVCIVGIQNSNIPIT